MRFFGPLFRSSSLDIPPFLVTHSLASRMLLLGLPLLAAVLLLIFFATGRSIESIVNRAIARNAQLQAQAMSLALGQILDETRNQLLILSAGSMDQEEMARRFKFRAQAGGLRYREVAFVGLMPEDRYLLLNYGGEIISVPLHVALDSPSGPFHSLKADQQPGHVNVGQPLEAFYSLVPVNKVLQSLSLYVLRFSTPIHDANGIFRGYLLLSLDLRELRDVVSHYSSPDAPLAAADGETRMRTFFFDKEGWMLFQSEPLTPEQRRPLSCDAVRAGFWGDFSRPGFSTAFRPGPAHLNYWRMVAEVQNGRPGQIAPSESGTSWNLDQMRVERVSYAPVTFKDSVDGPPVVLGGLAVLDTSFTTTRTGMQLARIYACCFLGGLFLLGLSLWWLARHMGQSLNAVSTALQSRNEQGSVEPLELPALPLELERIRKNVNALLERLRRAKARRISQEAEQTAQWQREAVTDLPQAADLPSSGLIGSSPAMQLMYDQIQKASQSPADVLIVGETGTGKELVSGAIHRLSPRADGPFMTINCGALDEALLMDTLFGHVKGAFTEAKQARKGAFLAAEGGTLMLDEVGNAAPKVQQALLRALSTRHIRPLGSDQDVPFDTRIIAATNAELHSDAQHGSFREDLYYRLAVITIRTPPLRKRKEDIPALTVYFLARAIEARQQAAGSGNPAENSRISQTPQIPQISRGALSKLMDYNWPGNVRELKNTLTRALTFCEGRIIYAENIQIGPGTPASSSSSRDAAGSATAEDAASTASASDSASRVAKIADNERTTGADAVSGPAPGQDEQERREVSEKTQRPDQKAERVDAWREHLPGGFSTELMDKLNHRQRELLPRLMAMGSVSRQDYQNLAGKDISMRTAQYDLQFLVRLGLVRKQGRGPALRYVFVSDSSSAISTSAGNWKAPEKGRAS